MVLDEIIEGMSNQGFSLPDRGVDRSMGLGLDDLFQTLKSPAVIALLSSLWTSIIAPVVKDLIVNTVEKTNDAKHNTDLTKKKEYSKKIQKYIREHGKDAGLTSKSAKKLSEDIVEWLEHHSAK